MTIRVIEWPYDQEKRKCIYKGCADTFSKESKNPLVWQAIDELKHKELRFIVIDGVNAGNKQYFIEVVK